MSKAAVHYEQHDPSDNVSTSAVSMSQVMAAGLASVGAAVVTSRFGVAGTIFGAAITTMIITGGSAILKSYLENLTSRVKRSPEKVRAGRFRRQSGRSESPSVVMERETPEGMTVYGRSRKGGAGRITAAFGWFSHLSSKAKRRILLGAAVPTILAFTLGMGAITGFEFVSGQPLSCSVGGTCQTAGTSGESSARTSFGSITQGDSGNTRSSNGTSDPSGGMRNQPDSSANQQQVQNQSNGSQNQNNGWFDNIQSGSNNGNGSSSSGGSQQSGGGQTPVYEQPSSGGNVPDDSATPPVEETPVEETPVEEAPVTPTNPAEPPSSGGMEQAPTP